MLTEERYATILKILEEKTVVSVLELTKLLRSSESTIRRDLNALEKKGKLHKVYGGATAIDMTYKTTEENVLTRHDLHSSDKRRIGQSAATLVKATDFVYIDAGSTTDFLVEYITETKATYVTNGLLHAQKLASKGLKTFILSGCIQAENAASAGAEALDTLKNYNFTKGFFGANGISIKSGFTTPDTGEGMVKKEALARCKKAFVLADPSKFNKIAPITFANLSCATIITTQLPDPKYNTYATIMEV